MHGAWTMSMMWMRMPGQTWLGAAAWFVAMWIVMMAAMMLPSHAPLLWRYGKAVGATGEARLAGRASIVGAGYLLVWALVGVAVFPIGAVLAVADMQWPPLARAVPFAAGALVLIAGALQCTAWSAHHLACWRHAATRCGTLPPSARAAWRQGLRLGAHCACSSVGPTSILLVAGMMNPRAMAVVTAAITVERLAPGGARAARVVGGAGVAAGMLLIARAVG